MKTSLLNLPRTFVWGVVIFWTGFTALVVAISWLGVVLRGYPPNVYNWVFWDSGWLIWTVETFLVVAIARALPLERGRMGRRVVLLGVVGLLVAFLHLQVELKVVNRIGALFSEPTEDLFAFEALFFYKFHVFYLIYWTIVGVTNAFDFYTRFRETELTSSRLAKELAESQLQGLKAQLHPHFLFNTHHSIIALMLKGDNETASRMLMRLSDLLRLVLDNPDRQTAALREELAALRLYINIQEQRFADRVRFVIDVPHDLETGEVPYLMLQPLVENAVTHGVDAGAGQGEVRIAGRLNGDDLMLTVTDPGREGTPTNITKEHHGIGLTNTRSRLARLYGGRGSLCLKPRAEGGMIAEVRIPWQVYRSNHEGELLGDKKAGRS